MSQRLLQRLYRWSTTTSLRLKKTALLLLVGAVLGITTMIPISLTHAQPAGGGTVVATGLVQAPPADEGPATKLPACSVTGGIFGAGTFMGCIARLVYYIIYQPIAWFAGLFGTLFDFFLGYSLDDSSYRAGFAVQGWQIVRDISNIFFIIILIWTGIATVFGINSVSMKKVVPSLLINALLINFSLFGTRVVIDISNIIARVFYNTMTVCEGDCKPDLSNIKPGIAGYKPVSEAIISSFNPQTIFAPELLDSSKSTKNQLTQGGKDQADDSSELAGYFIIITIIAAALVFTIGMMFFKVAFFFLGRVIGLYVTMIFAPFAVLTRDGMPLVGGIEQLAWGKWKSDLISYAILAPVFIFFLYIILLIVKSGFFKFAGPNASNSFFETVIYLSIPMLIIYFMMSKGVSLAKKFAGDIGKTIQSFGEKTVGLAGGLALGGAALAGGRVFGGLATKINSSKTGEWLRDKGKSSGFGGFIARRSISTLNNAENNSFDFRKNTLGKKIFKEMGVDTDQKALGALAGVGLGFSTSSTAGGYKGQIDRYQKKQEAEAKLLESKQSQSEIDAFNDKNKKEYQDKVDSIIEEKMNAAYTKAQVDKWKTSDPKRYEKERQSILRMNITQKAIAAIEKPVEKASVQEVNAKRKDAFSENLKKGSVVDNFLGEDSLVGAMLGANTRSEASRKAAKKISDSAKIEKDLTEINDTLKSGFREIVAMESLRDNDVWKKDLTADQRTALMRGEKITFKNKAGKDVEGGFYDFAKEKDPSLAAAVDIDVSTAENNKDQKKNILDQIKARQQFKFDFKTLNSNIKTAEDTYAQNPTAKNWDEVVKLKNERVKLKNEQKKWQDLDKYIDEQKKKLEGKE